MNAIYTIKWYKMRYRSIKRGHYICPAYTPDPSVSLPSFTWSNCSTVLDRIARCNCGTQKIWHYNGEHWSKNHIVLIIHTHCEVQFQLSNWRHTVERKDPDVEPPTTTLNNGGPPPEPHSVISKETIAFAPMENFRLTFKATTWANITCSLTDATLIKQLLYQGPPTVFRVLLSITQQIHHVGL